MDLKRRNSEILTEAPSPLTETAGHDFVRYLFSLTLLVLYCLLPTLTLAGAAYVQQNGTAALYDASPVTSTVITISTAPAVGNTIIITFSANRSSGSGSLNCSDNMGNSYTTDLVNEYISSPPNYVTVAICSAQVAAAKVPSTITLTHHQSYNRVAMVQEYSGVLSAPAADRSSSGGGNSSSPSSGTTATTTQANELLVGAIAVFDGTTTIFNSDGSFSGGPFRLAQNSGTDQRTLQTQYRIVSSTGAYTYAPTLTASKKWAAGIVTYKASPTCTVTNINDSGAGSLRNCITTANSTPGTTINFNIATAANQSSGGDSWWRIALATRLPDISGANTIIDGTTQTTSQGNTNTLGPEIEINGTTAGAGGWDGFSVVSPATGVAIKGFIINKWTGSGVVLWSGTGTITGNYIGTNYAGAAALGNTDYGIYVGTNGNVIGGTTVADRNVIAGNIGPGIHVDSSNNIIQGNYIGVNVTATAVLANTSYGIGLGAAATGNTIGGTAAGAGNVISGNTTDGINHSASGTNNVYGNYIGTNASSAALANGGIGLSTSAGTINLGNAGEVQSNIIGPNTGVGINLVGGTLNLSGTVTVNDDVTFSTGALAMGSATLNLSGNWTRTSATVTPGTSTVNLNGTANQTITSGGATFYHLTLNNTGASGSDKIRIAGALDVNGTLTITDGLLDISTTAPANNATVNTAGNVTIAAAGSIDVTGRTANWTFDGTSILTDASGGGPQQLNNVVLNGTSLTLGSAAKMKSFTNTLGTMNLGGSGYILELTGTGTPLSNSGTFTAGTSTVKYTGTTTATNIATVPYSSLWLAPTAATTYSLTGHLTGGNAMTGNLTVDTNATLDVVSGSNYNLTTVNVMLNGTYLARVSTINVGGNWNMTNGTFTRGTSTVNFTGTGTITNNNASWWAKSFYNLTAAAAGNTTTFDTTTGGVNIVNVLTLGTGTLSGGQALLSKDTGTPLITAGATLSNSAFKYDGSTGPVNVAATTYPELWVAGNNPVNTFNLAGNIACSNLFIYGNGSGNTAVLDTTISNYSINCNLLSVGTNAATTYGTLTLNNSTATINGNVTIYSSDASGANQINAGGSTINLSGSWTNNDTFIASTGTVVFNGANQTVTGNTTFNNLTKSVTTARTLTFAAGSTTTINGVATFNAPAANC